MLLNMKVEQLLETEEDKSETISELNDVMRKYVELMVEWESDKNKEKSLEIVEITKKIKNLMNYKRELEEDIYSIWEELHNKY